MKPCFTLLKDNWWMLFITAFSLISLASELASSGWEMIDLEVYYRTAQHMIAGEELYGIALDADGDGHYIYKYSATAAILFMPLAILPFWTAKIVYWVSLTFLLGLALQKFYNLVKSESKSNERLLKNAIFFALLTILIHFDSELHLGQVNLLLLVMYVFVIFAFTVNKPILLAFLLALSIFIKPFGLIFLPYLLLKKRYLELLYFSGFTVVLFVLPFLFYPSVASFIELNTTWINELTVELGNKQDLFAKANHTIFSIIARYTPLQFILGGLVWQKIYQIIVLGIIGLLFFKFERKHLSVLAEMAVLIILIPLFAFTSKNAFLFTMPLALYLLSHYKTLTKSVKTLTIAGCVLIGGNLYEVYGPEISMFLTEISMYSIGSICLLIAIYFFKKSTYQSLA